MNVKVIKIWMKNMSIGTLFLRSNLTSILTFSELDWITNQQSKFSRLEQSIAFKLGRLFLIRHYKYWMPFKQINLFYKY